MYFPQLSVLRHVHYYYCISVRCDEFGKRCIYVYIYIYIYSEAGWGYFEATAGQRASRENSAPRKLLNSYQLFLMFEHNLHIVYMKA
jgi:hypothetical protein